MTMTWHDILDILQVLDISVMLFKQFIMSLVISHISSYFIWTYWVPMIKKKKKHCKRLHPFLWTYVIELDGNLATFVLFFNEYTFFPKIRELDAFCQKHLILLSHFVRLCYAVVSHMISCGTLPLSGPGKNCVDFLLYHEWYRQMSPES